MIPETRTKYLELLFQIGSKIVSIYYVHEITVLKFWLTRPPLNQNLEKKFQILELLFQMRVWYEIRESFNCDFINSKTLSLCKIVFY